MKQAKTEQNEQEEEIDDPLNEHRSQPTKHVYKQLYQITLLQVIIKMNLQEMKYTVSHQEIINTQY